MKTINSLIICALPMALAACGGGGGGDVSSVGHTSTSRNTWSSAGNWHSAEGGANAGNRHSAEGSANAGNAFTGQAPMTGAGSNQAFMPPSQAEQRERTGGTTPGESVPDDKAPGKEATAKTVYPVKTAILRWFEQPLDKTFYKLSGTFHGNLPHHEAHGYVEYNKTAATVSTREGSTGYWSQQFLSLWKTDHNRSRERRIDLRYTDFYDGHFNFRETYGDQMHCVPQHSYAFPDDAKVGDHGIIAEVECRREGASDRTGPIVGTRRISYRTSANPNGGLNFVMTREIQNNDKAGLLTVEFDYDITADGNATLIGIKLKRSRASDLDFAVTAH